MENKDEAISEDQLAQERVDTMDFMQSESQGYQCNRGEMEI